MSENEKETEKDLQGPASPHEAKVPPSQPEQEDPPKEEETETKKDAIIEKPNTEIKVNGNGTQGSSQAMASPRGRVISNNFRRRAQGSLYVDPNQLQELQKKNVSWKKRL